MKRLKLEVFKAKNINKNKKQVTDKLLGQVLGDCHDEPQPRGVPVASDDDDTGGGTQYDLK